jgi:hypothetical protein
VVYSVLLNSRRLRQSTALYISRILDACLVQGHSLFDVVSGVDEVGWDVLRSEKPQMEPQSVTDATVSNGLSA